MPEVSPIPASLYHPSLTPEDVLSPPYDVISDEEKEIYRGLSPYNIVRAILPDSHAQAGELLRRWVAEEVLVREEEPSYFWCRQEYEWQGTTRVSGGLIGLLRLEEPGRGGILPHEKTIPSVRQDQLEWLRSSRANAAPIMILYRDRMKTVESLVSREATKEEPLRVYRDREGVVFRLWKVPRAPEIAELFDGRGVFIADGHHRYASARQFSLESREPGAAHVMAYFLNSSNHSLMVFPFHRCLAEAGEREESLLKESFSLEPLAGPEALVERLREGFLGFGRAGRFYSFAVPEGKGPAVHYLHREVLEGVLEWDENHLSYERDTARAAENVRAGSASVFFLPAVSASLLHEVWKKGLILPRKSTCFYPKIPSGLVVYRHQA